MTIDTGQRTMRIQFQKLLFAIITGITVAFMFIPVIAVPVSTWGIPPMGVVIFVLALYIAYQLYFVVRDVEYLFVSDTQLPEMLRVRHFKIRPFAPGKFAIEIPHAQLHSYSVVSSLLGLRRRVVLRQLVEGRVYVYPPFSITLLSRGERQLLIDCLDQYMPAQ